MGLSRVVAGFLWGVPPTDPAMLGVVAATLLGVALAASWIPAREAADPRGLVAESWSFDRRTCETPMSPVLRSTATQPNAGTSA